MIEIKQKVDKIIDYYLVPIDGKFTPESRLIDDLEADELDSIEILMELEKQFNINIPDSEWILVKTVQDIYNIVEQKLQNK